MLDHVIVTQKSVENMSYTVWANDVPQSIELQDLEEAREFAHETNMDFVIKDQTGQVVYTAKEYEFSRYYVEQE